MNLSIYVNKMYNIRHFGKVENGKIILDNKNDFWQEIEKYEGKKIAITIVQKRALRSDEQLRYYWAGVIGTIADYCGYETKEEMLIIHEYLKDMFCPKKVIEFLKKEIMMTKSTSNLDTKEFTTFVDQIKRWALTECNGLVIPEADQIDINKIKIDKKWYG